MRRRVARRVAVLRIVRQCYRAAGCRCRRGGVAPNSPNSAAAISSQPAASPVPGGQTFPQRGAEAPQAAYKPRKFSKKAVGIGLAVVVAAVAVVGAGLFTNWFGLASKGTWVPVKEVGYNSDGSVYSTFDFEVDSRGSTTKRVFIWDPAHSPFAYSEDISVDSNGNMSQLTRTSDSSDSDNYTETYSTKNRSDGKPEEIVRYRDGEEVSRSSYAWQGTGKAATVSTSGRLVTNGELSDDRYTTSVTYGDDGWITYMNYRNEGEDGESKSYSYNVSYDKDFGGNIVGYTVAGNYGGSDFEHKYTCQNDSSGNIASVFDEEGKLVHSYEYKRIDDPWPRVVYAGRSVYTTLG